MKILKSKRNIACFTALVLVVLFIIFFCGYYGYFVKKHPFKRGIGDVSLTVKNGDNLYSILDQIDNKGCFNSKLLIKVYIKTNNIKLTELKPGKYVFKSGITLKDFLNQLKNQKAHKDTITVTFPEGYTIEDIANTLNSKGIIGRTDFLTACKNYKLPSYITVNSNRKYELEGFLFPDTYEFKKNISGDDIIKTMLNRFEYVVNDIEKKENVTINDSNLDKTIIMASIVEKEIKSPDERALASSVFYNRLKINMKFQSCATVEYALGYHKDILYDKDTKIKSPYNTYIVKGYPAGPIACPGRAAIVAALKPAKTDYLYFVSKNDGTHFFTKSEAEFEKAKAKYQKH